MRDRVLDQLILSGGFSLSKIAGYLNGTWAKWVPYWYFGARYSADNVAAVPSCDFRFLETGAFQNRSMMINKKDNMKMKPKTKLPGLSKAVETVWQSRLLGLGCQTWRRLNCCHVHRRTGIDHACH